MITTTPWGTYEVLASGDGWQVKRLIINPGHSTSLQYHEHRTENLNVVEGTLWLTRGLNRAHFQLGKGEGRLIEHTEIHRLENVQEVPVVIIEIQYGENIS